MLAREVRTPSIKHLAEELGNVIANGPLWPGDTIAHENAYELERRGFIQRCPDGRWLATEKGRREWDALLRLAADAFAAHRLAQQRSTIERLTSVIEARRAFNDALSALSEEEREFFRSMVE